MLPPTVPRERKSRKRFFCVYTIGTKHSVSKNILKINGHDFVMSHDLELFTLARLLAEEGLATISWLIGASLELKALDRSARGFNCQRHSTTIVKDALSLTMLMLMISRTCWHLSLLWFQFVFLPTSNTLLVVGFWFAKISRALR